MLSGLRKIVSVSLFSGGQRARPWLLFVLREVERLRTSFLVQSLATCGEGCTFRFPLKIEGPDRVQIGSRVSIASFVHIWGHGGVTIGDDCLIASHAAIISVTHNTKSAVYNSENVVSQVRIGRNVWIGAHAVIMPGVTVGDSAIVGAGAVVTRDVEARSTVIGVPARAVSGK